MREIDFKTIKDARRILIYGGSFDPPHMGHVTLSQQACQYINADFLLVIPAGKQPLKDPYVTSAQDRIELVKRAFLSNDDAILVTYEVEQNECEQTVRPTYTYDTLKWLKAYLPNVELRLLLGADQLGTIDRWYQYQAVIDMATPLVMTRDEDDVESLLKQLPNTDPEYLSLERWRAWIISLPLFTISSSEIRKMIMNREDKAKYQSWLAPDVLAYIEENNLYR